MTDERVRQILAEKGFRTNFSGGGYKRESYSCVLVYFEQWDNEEYRVRVLDRPGFNVAGFRNPIAAATYAERHVIPALLAGKESA